jgi:hypothetical protein
MYPKTVSLESNKINLIILFVIQLLNVIMGSEIHFGQKLLNFVFYMQCKLLPLHKIRCLFC